MSSSSIWSSDESVYESDRSEYVDRSVSVRNPSLVNNISRTSSVTSHAKSSIKSTTNSNLSYVKSTTNSHAKSTTNSYVKSTTNSHVKSTTNSNLSCVSEISKKVLSNIYKNKNDNIAICFLVDCTGSMKPYINEIKNNILHIVETIKRPNTREIKIKVSFIGYSDYPNDNDTYELYQMPFTENYYHFKSHLSKVHTHNGIDYQEDVLGGLYHAVNMVWPDGIRLLFHIADYPGHGYNWFTSTRITDRFPNGHPNDHSYEDLLKKVLDLQIEYYFGKILSTTDKMILDFSKIITICTLDIMKPINLCSKIVQSVNKSIAKNTYNESKDIIVNCKIVSYNQPNTIKQLSDYYEFDTTTEKAKVYIIKTKFNNGSFKNAYYGKLYLDGNEQSVVFKKYKNDISDDFVVSKYLRESEMSNIASYLARIFNEISNQICIIKFLESKVVCTKDQCYLLEPRIDDDKFTRFTNNSSWISESCPLIDLLTAFSHWTYSITNKYLMIVDLQGTIDKNSRIVYLTDPAIHCDKHRTRFGSTNLGKKGIQSFFNSHRCNSICKLLGL